MVSVSKLPDLYLGFKLPKFWADYPYDKDQGHYWEMGRKGYSKKTIKKELSKFFEIKQEFYPKMHRHHYFFCLRKEECQLK